MMIVALGTVATAAACKKSADRKEPGSASGAAVASASGALAATGTAPTTDPPATTSGPGVEAGGIERAPDEGAAAVITAATGTIEVRRVGETEYAAAAASTPLYPGDQVRAGETSTATIALADESVVELAEVSTLAIGSRDGTADPASSAAVLAGLARFTVTARAPGEGPFRVYTPAGMVVTRGTVYTVGVAVSGEARVGVESGAVEVVGLADVAAPPVAVEAGSAVSLEAAGTVAAPAAWTTDDWGAWRLESDAEVEAGAAMTAHASALADLEAQLAAAYADLEASAAAAAAFEATAATAAEASATADYEAAAPEGAATIEASFSVAGNIEALTWAYGSRATLAADIYVRHPDAVQAQWQVIAPRVDAAVLWPKRFEVTSSAYLQPLRVQYYVHHPRGRAHAQFVGVAVPAFYASAKVEDPDPVAVRARVKTRVYVAPVVAVKAQGRGVWLAAPPANWHARIKVKPAPMRARVGWYVRPPDAKASVLIGMPVKAKVASSLTVGAPRPRADLHAGFKTSIGGRVKIDPPDLGAAAKARMKVKLGAGGVVVRQPVIVVGAAGGAAGDVRTKLDAAATIKGDVKAKAPDVKVKADRIKTDVKTGIGARAGAAGDAQAGVKGKAEAKADVKVKIKVPPPPPPPKVEVKGKLDVKGGIKIGG